ncbi:hypothetical protein B296_00013879 [Ensete ventricosum]|uniref:Uncharacterized protein n=1 Tax=Ensete ventricosum TaxID=4639 RepID=A0A426Y797_ENSVE|nr:hypothetical protein B296_00013879 [Ensete ventricosum]
MIWLPSWIMSSQLAITRLGRQTLASWLWLQAVDGGDDNSGREQSKSREEARGVGYSKGARLHKHRKKGGWSGRQQKKVEGEAEGVTGSSGDAAGAGREEGSSNGDGGCMGYNGRWWLSAGDGRWGQWMVGATMAARFLWRSYSGDQLWNRSRNVADIYRKMTAERYELEGSSDDGGRRGSNNIGCGCAATSWLQVALVVARGLVIWEEEEVVVFRITGPRCGELMTRSPKFMYRHGATVDTLANSNQIKPC